jgi:CRP-like cAMP-binding protein
MTMDDEIIKKIDIFFTQYKKQLYRKNEVLVRSDENPAGVYYLKEGLVKCYVLSKKGDEIVLNIFKPLSFFPMSWAINDTENIFYYEALTPIEVWLAPKTEVIQLIKKEHDVLYKLLSRVFIGTDGLLLRLAHLKSGNAYARLLSEILISSKRFGRKNKKTGAIYLKIREKDFARQAGMTRETVSRELKILKNTGIVTYTKNLLKVNNIDLLQKELEKSF